jgi:hypothetical protein
MNLTLAFEALARSFEESSAAIGRLSSYLTWLVEAGEIVPEEPVLELNNEDRRLLTGLKVSLL